MVNQEDPAPLDHVQVVTFIGKHAKQLALLASEHGCMTLYYLLQTAVEHAEKELSEQRGNGGSSVS
jgi:hypothetical protein